MRPKLSEEKKRTIETLLLEGHMKYKEIAKVTGVSESTVYRIMRDIEISRPEEKETEQKDDKPEEKKVSNFRTRNRQDKYYVSHY